LIFLPDHQLNLLSLLGCQLSQGCCKVGKTESVVRPG
jgi:hypothetical protein